MGYNYKAIRGTPKISNRPAWIVGSSGLGIGLGGSGYIVLLEQEVFQVQ